MAREIKFRAWIDNGSIKEMHYSNEIEMNSADANSLWSKVGFINVYPEKRVIEDWQKEIIWMQYTGLKDMHDKEIYEGDIFRYWLRDIDESSNNSTEYVEEVMFVNGSFDLDNCALGAFHGMGEVIGNIYENPDLLK